ncbi:hypothetical protein ACJ72_04157 [Emergomyces africanus]|uniref:SRR1-like domain-containing protein n=1 Tax=Emergomyces africanus TaxID=1955775 RepID=A0A1B7NXK1_9EURO|nr:hypothetical protein ACJ72_04157 [Emergomyces africanus]
MTQSTSRRKGRCHQPKRVQVHDEEGWTHITTTERKTFNKHCLPPIKDLLIPAEAPDGLTFKNLKKQFESHKRGWEESRTWQTMKAALDSGLIAGAGSRVDNCVCVGLGSPSGFLRGGWVDRRAVSLYQLAALVTMLEYFGAFLCSIFLTSVGLARPLGVDRIWNFAKELTGRQIRRSIAHQDTLPTAIKDCYAQDPVFNTLDKQLLESHGIRVVEHPEAFTLINERTFLYSPGAERVHILDMLPSNPALFFGGPLDGENILRLPDDKEKILSEFLNTRRLMLLPPFDPNIPAFWKSSLFWRPEDS